jgi:hypothetical protein
MSADEQLTVQQRSLRFGRHLALSMYVLCCALAAWLALGPLRGKMLLVYGIALASYGSWLLGERLWGLGAARLRWSALARERARRLKGVEQGRAEAVERSFWLEAQRDALVSQRVRHPTPPRGLSWREAWRCRLAAWQLTPRHLALLFAALWGFGILLLIIDGVGSSPAEWLLLSLIFPCSIFAWLGLESWVMRHNSAADALAWERERLHLAELARLAGQQVAEEEVAAALQRWRDEQPETLDNGTAVVAFIMLSTGLFVYYPLIAPLVYISRLVSRRRAASRVAREQDARRQLWLTEAGVDALPPTDARRVAAERRFWRGEQALAASALRERFAREPAPLSLRGALSQRVRLHRNSLKGLAIVALAALVLCSIGELYLGWEPIVLRLFFPFILVFLTCIVAVGLLIESVIVRSRRADQRHIFTNERRRIATMAELAGGLSLAEHEPDDALRGALSGDVAQQGALSEVDP